MIGRLYRFLRPAAAKSALRVILPRRLAPAELLSTGDGLADDQRHAIHAHQLLEDELLRWSVTEMNHAARERLETCSINDIAGLQGCRMMIDVLRTFEANLIGLVSAGKLADAELVHREERADFAKRTGVEPV